MKIIKIIPFILIIYSSIFAAALERYESEGIVKISSGNAGIKQITLDGNALSCIVKGGTSKEAVVYLSEKSISPEDIDKLKFTGSAENKFSSADITVSGKEFKINLTNEKNKELYALILTPEEISVAVLLKSGNIKVENIKGEMLIDGKSISTTIKDTSGVINYRNKSGDLKIDNFEGVLDIKTYSGDISLGKITGSVKAENISGDLTVQNLNGNISAKLDVGNINLTEIKESKADIESKSGEIKINSSNGSELNINSSMGNITIDNSDFGLVNISQKMGEVNIGTTSGDISIDMNMGEINIKDLQKPVKKDTEIILNFGEINITLKDPSDFNIEGQDGSKTGFSSNFEMGNSVRICGKNNKCLSVKVSMGDINIK